MRGDAYPLWSLFHSKINQSVQADFSAYCILRIKSKIYVRVWSLEKSTNRFPTLYNTKYKLDTKFKATKDIQKWELWSE